LCGPRATEDDLPEEEGGSNNGNEVQWQSKDVSDNAVLYTSVCTVKKRESGTYGTELGQRLAEEFTELFALSSGGSNLSSLFNQIGASLL
jgi:hypothetical protein